MTGPVVGLVIPGMTVGPGAELVVVVVSAGRFSGLGRGGVGVWLLAGGWSVPKNTSVVLWMTVRPGPAATSPPMISATPATSGAGEGYRHPRTCRRGGAAARAGG